VPLEGGGDAGSEVSEWELRERRERLEARGEEAETPGAVEEEGEELPLFLPTPHSWHLKARSRGRMAFFFVLPFVNFLGRIYSFLGQAWAEGKGGACNEPSPYGLRTRKLGKNVRRHDLYRSNASMIKQKKNPPLG